MKQDLTRIYTGADLSGAASGVIYLPIVRPSTLEKVSVRTDQAQTGNAVFEVRKNNVVVTGLGALTINAGAKIGSVAGLSIALADGDEIALNLISGSVSAPVTISLETDDGAGGETAQTVGSLIAGAGGKNPPLDADVFGYADSAAANILKKFTWLNLKTALKTAFDSIYVTGALSATDSAIALFDGVSGELIKDSGKTLAQLQDALVSGANIKTVNGSSLLGSGNLTIEGGGGSGGISIQSFNSSGTWTRPTGAKMVEVFIVGGGGGGGSARKGAVGTNRFSGGGGSGGAAARYLFSAAQVGATAAVTVGAGGAGGAQVTANSTNGNGGGNGGDTSFGAFLIVSGGAGGGGSGGAPGTGGAARTGFMFTQYNSVAGAGGQALNGQQPGAPVFAGGSGGSGGGMNTGNTTWGGGTGGNLNIGNGAATISGGSGGAAGVNGGAGSSAAANAFHGGSGGGGGGSSNTGNSGSGGAGGFPGGGGGSGGAATDDAGNAGKGGDGANGVVVVITYL